MMRIATVLAAALAVLSACASTVPARVTWGPSMRVTEGRVVSLGASDQRARVERSLGDAGIAVSDSSAPYQLRVDIGNSRRSKGCGSVNNVRYILYKGGVRILAIKARGPTGECQPNTFDDMSRLLATYFEGR
ncbi:MAG: hypothetical protein QNK04_00725 [Myxococcota bacterium]|nr:hypothetical protein [Myxococcota bacterium]